MFNRRIVVVGFQTTAGVLILTGALSSNILNEEKRRLPVSLICLSVDKEYDNLGLAIWYLEK